MTTLLPTQDKMKKLLVAAATPFEIAPLLEHLEADFQKQPDGSFTKSQLEVRATVTGVGMANTGIALGRELALHRYDLAINAGIAGAFNRSLQLGDVVCVVSERFADLGVEEADGTFTDVHELGLVPHSLLPYQQGELRNDNLAGFDFLPSCKGLTVNKIHGSQTSIAAIMRKYPADVESMEGAAFFLACLLSGTPFLEIRAISNYVEPRNREAWNLPLAIGNLNRVLVEMMALLQ